jgi:O-antigen/teichoic acid export membrane protein
VPIQKKLIFVREKIKKSLSSNSRNSKVALTGIVALIVRAISIGTGIISIPITAKYLGTEQFGVWILLSTLMNWITLADLGLVNSLVNILATALAEGSKGKAKEAVSSTFYPMLLLGLILFSISIVSSNYIHWERFLNIQSSSSLMSDTRLAITICMCLFSIKIPLSIPRCIYTSYQEGYIYQIWVGLANILSLLFLILAQYNDVTLPWLIGVFFGVLTLGDLFAGIHLFGFRQQWLKPKIANCNITLFRKLLKNGFQFWIAQICAICIFQTDLIIVSRLFSVTELGVYGVLMRLFSIIETVSSTFVMPLWPAYNDAYARGDYKWMNRAFRTSIVGASIWSICTGGLLVIFSPLILNSWLGKSIDLPAQLPFFMLFTYVLLSVSQCVAVLVNALGRLKLQTFVAPISALSNIILSIMLGRLMGLHGVTLATTICILIFSILIVGGDAISAMNKIDLNTNTSR